MCQSKFQDIWLPSCERRAHRNQTGRTVKHLMHVCSSYLLLQPSTAFVFIPLTQNKNTSPKDCLHWPGNVSRSSGTSCELECLLTLTHDAALLSLRLSAPFTHFLNDKGQYGHREREPDCELLQHLPVQNVRTVPEDRRRSWSIGTVDAVGRLFLWTERQEYSSVRPTCSGENLLDFWDEGLKFPWNGVMGCTSWRSILATHSREDRGADLKVSVENTGVCCSSRCNAGAFVYNSGIIFRFTQLAAATNQIAMLDGAAVSDPTHQISVVWAFCSVLMCLTIKKTSSLGGFWQWKMAERDVERSVAGMRRRERKQEEENCCNSAACAAHALMKLRLPLAPHQTLISLLRGRPILHRSLQIFNNTCAVLPVGKSVIFSTFSPI